TSGLANGRAALCIGDALPRRNRRLALLPRTEESGPNARAIRQCSSFLRGHRPQISNEIVKVTIGHGRIKWKVMLRDTDTPKGPLNSSPPLPRSFTRSCRSLTIGVWHSMQCAMVAI